MPRRTPTHGGEVSIALAREDDRAVVDARDNGAASSRRRRAGSSSCSCRYERRVAASRSHGGVGIGLSLVQRLVELHGGARSKRTAPARRGSDFSVRLPVLDGRMPAAADEGAAAPPPAGGGRVLVIDDDAHAAESLAMVLEMLGFPVAQAANLESAVRQARGFVPEVVVTDLAMPGADGYEVMRRLKTLPNWPAPATSRSAASASTRTSSARAAPASRSTSSSRSTRPSSSRRCVNCSARRAVPTGRQDESRRPAPVDRDRRVGRRRAGIAGARRRPAGRLPGAAAGRAHVGMHPSVLPALLEARGKLSASHAVDGEPLRAGHIHVAPPDHHMLVEGSSIRLSRGAKEHHSRPAIDPLFRRRRRRTAAA